MAAPNINFSASIESLEGRHKLMLSDTTEYDETETVVNSRSWYVTKTDGSMESVIDSNGTAEYLLLKDSALVVELEINKDTANQNPGYSKVINVLASPNLFEGLYDVRKKLVELYSDNCNVGNFRKFLDDVHLISSFEEASKALISTDILAAQKAVDFGNKLIEKSKFST